MRQKPVRILLLEASRPDARWLEEVVAEILEGRFVNAWTRPFEVFHLERLGEAIPILNHRSSFDLILLNPELPDSQGMHAFLEIRRRAPHLPLVALLEREDEDLSLSLIAGGAQDVLVKADLDCLPMARSLSLAVERKRRETAIEALSMRDPLTGLFNRTGLTALAQRDWALAARAGKPLLLLLIAWEGLAALTRAYGKQERDLALIDGADLLRGCLPEHCLAARVAEDRFAVLSLEDTRLIPCLVERAFHRFARRKADRGLLSIRVSAAIEDRPSGPPDIDALWTSAEAGLCDNSPCGVMAMTSGLSVAV